MQRSTVGDGEAAKDPADHGLVVGEVNEAKKGKFKNLPEEENPAIAELVHPHTLLDILVPIVPLFNQMHIDTDFLAPDVVDDNELDVDHVNPIEDTFKGLDEDITFMCFLPEDGQLLYPGASNMRTTTMTPKKMPSLP